MKRELLAGVAVVTLTRALPQPGQTIMPWQTELLRYLPPPSTGPTILIMPPSVYAAVRAALAKR